MTLSDSHPNPGEYARGATVFGRCVIDRCVRRDRIASVFAAHDVERTSEWFYVWKARADQITRKAGAGERFAREMERVRAVKHASLPTIVAWDISGESPSVLSVMPRGRSLRDVIASEPFLGAEDVARVVVAVGDALTALHQTKPPVMHLGLCPERVHVGDDGGVWLEDAGYLDALIVGGYLTTLEAVAGAQPGYVIPAELLAPPSAMADVFQLAVLAFEALTGQLPFGAAGQGDLPASLLASALPSAAALRPGLTPDTDEVFDRVWSVSMGGAPESALAFSRDLARVLGEDRSLRPTFPGAVFDQARRVVRTPAASPAVTDEGRGPRRVSIVHGLGDNVDNAFDDMLRVDEPSDVHAPQVIEFTPAGLRLDPSIAQALSALSPPAVDVTSVKPTLVGATGIRLSTHPPPPRGISGRPPRGRPPTARPPLDDNPTPSVGYERVKLMPSEATPVGDARRSEPYPVDLTDEAEAELTPGRQGNPDATSQIEQELLEVLRRTGTTSNPSAQKSGASGPVPRARVAHASKRPSRRSDEVPPPPSNATRPSATPARPKFPVPRERSHVEGTRPSSPTDRSSRTTTGEIPPPPKLPFDAQAMFDGTAPPTSGFVPSLAPEITLQSLSEEPPFDATLATGDIEEMTPAQHGLSARPPALPPEVSATLHEEVGRSAAADRTQPAGSPLPPRPSRDHADHPPIARPSKPTPSSDASQKRNALTPQQTPSRAAQGDPTTQPVLLSGRSAVRGATPSSTPKPAGRLSVPGDPTRPSAVPSGRKTEPPPAPTPQVDPAWAFASRVLGVSTVIASLLVTSGLVYIRSSLDGLREELARARLDAVDAGAAVVPVPEPVPVTADAADVDASLMSAVVDAGTASDVLPMAPDAEAAADITATQADVATRPEADASARPAGVPPESVRVRLMGQMRGGVNDCIEGVEEPRFVVVNVRFDGVMGTVQRVRLHGIFAEPPLGPCIEEVIRRAQTSPFPAPFWDVDFRFPVPLPRWRPPM